jgi:hypothetical protein
VPDDVPVVPDDTITWVLAWLLPLEFVAVRMYCVEIPGATAVDPLAATWPIPGWMFMEVALATLQLKVEDAPAVMLPGDALNELIAGIPVVEGAVDGAVLVPVPVPWTVTCVEAVVLPVALVAVRIYVVVAAGATALIPLTATFPIPLSRLTLFAPVTVQLSVVLPPGLMLAEPALNEVITGGFFAVVQPGK